jgi:hypothetical protein
MHFLPDFVKSSMRGALGPIEVGRFVRDPRKLTVPAGKMVGFAEDWQEANLTKPQNCD